MLEPQVIPSLTPTARTLTTSWLPHASNAQMVPLRFSPLAYSIMSPFALISPRKPFKISHNITARSGLLTHSRISSVTYPSDTTSSNQTSTIALIVSAVSLSSYHLASTWQARTTQEFTRIHSVQLGLENRPLPQGSRLFWYRLTG